MQRAAQQDSKGLSYFLDLSPPTDHFMDDVVSGMAKDQKTIPPKYFYDKKGSELFDEICRTGEYYITRTELGILNQYSDEIARHIGPDCRVIEFGSGASLKIRLLLDALDQPAEYVAIDISKDFLRQSALTIANDYPDLDVGAICADFTKPIDLPRPSARVEGRQVGFLPGSTIGNFAPAAAEEILRSIRSTLSVGGYLVIGVDLKKDKDVLEAAYNDARGVTRSFNLNLLDRVNRELDADIVVEDFEHTAFYDEDEGRIEMHLRAVRPTSFQINGNAFEIAHNETIHTENSHKYSVAEFRELASKAGFSGREVWLDKQHYFSLHLLEVLG